MNLRSGHRSTSVGMGRGLGEDQGENGRGDDNGNANGESHEAPLLGPPLPPPPPPMTYAKMMAKMLVAHHESARALEMLAQAIGGFARGGPGGNGGNGGGARGPEGPCSYQDLLKTHPPMCMPSAEPLYAENWLRILEQKFLLLTITEKQKVRFVAQQL